MIKNIIFDLGGVVLKHKPDLIPHILSELFSLSKEESAELWKEYGVKLLKGDLLADDFFAEINLKFQTKYSVSELISKWRDLYIKNADVDRDLLAFIQILRKNFNVYLLTDTTDLNNKFNEDRNIYNNFTEVFKSFEERVTKAEGSEFFIRVLKKISAQPDECIFIDDMEINIKRAEDLGMKGIVYKGLSELKSELAGLGVRT